MIRLLVDENFNGTIVRGLFQRNPALDLVRVQDLEIAGAEDSTVLEWAAREACVVLTHDVRTMTRFAYGRLKRGERMPGVLVVTRSVPVATAIDDILVVAEASQEGEWEGQVRHLPL